MVTLMHLSANKSVEYLEIQTLCLGMLLRKIKVFRSHVHSWPHGHLKIGTYVVVEAKYVVLCCTHSWVQHYSKPFCCINILNEGITSSQSSCIAIKYNYRNLCTLLHYIIAFKPKYFSDINSIPEILIKSKYLSLSKPLYLNSCQYI